MQYKSQEEALQQLEMLARANRQSIIIEGPSGSGKSYIARQYASMVNVSDFASVEPKVADIREAVDACIQNGTKLLMCIENLDCGVAAASYTLLKFLEEPIEGVYIVITCRDLKLLPDTIPSRSTVVTLQPPRMDDLSMYAESKDRAKFLILQNKRVWRCCHSFTDADAILAMNATQIDYYESINQLCKFTDSITNIVWNLSHYDNNNACNVELAIRCVMDVLKKPFITKCGVECIRDLSSKRIAQHAVLAKFAFNCKYCE